MSRLPRWASVIPSMDDKLELVKHLETILASKKKSENNSELKVQVQILEEKTYDPDEVDEETKQLPVS